MSARNRLATACLSILVAAVAGAEETPGYLNLDFESPGFPREWYTGSEGYAVDLDSTDAYSGRQCLRVRYLYPGRIGVASQQVSAAFAEGRTLGVRAHVRTQGVGTGWAGIWCRIDGADRMLAYATSRDHAAAGSAPWAEVSIAVPVDSAATEITFGAVLAGDGAAWFDRFELDRDGVPFVEPPAPAVVDPGPASIEWLRAHAVPLGTDDPEQDNSDLIPVLGMIGNARVVGLGEGTHGTREFLRMKHRLIRALVEELGFRRIALETNLPETEALNRYIQTGEGDPRELLRGMRLWTWETEEVLGLVEWMRSYNASGKGPVELFGFDMQQPEGAIDSLEQFTRRADPDYAPALSESLRIIAKTHEVDARGTAGSAAAVLRGGPFSGKRVRLSGWIRTEAIDEGGAGLWFRAEGESTRTVRGGMDDGAPSGTTDWNRYVVDVRVPRRTRRVAFGATLRGDGAAWFDSLALEVDGRAVRAGPDFDLDFEGPRPLGGLRGVGPGYRMEVDTTTARFGRGSLAIHQDAVSAAAARSRLWMRAVAAAEGIRARLEAESLRLLARFPEPEVARAVRNARLVEQACRTSLHPPARDANMAENVAWLLSRAPSGSKIILWAHNSHVSRRDGAMGSYLTTRYGTDYANVAFALHEGSYTAAAARGLSAIPAMPSQPGSLEWALHRTGLPRLALDLRLVSPEDSASAWLAGEPELRNIGALPVAHGFYRTRISQDFDTVIFFDQTTPSRPLTDRGTP